MKWFKRFTYACLSSALLFALAGCGGSSNTPATDSQESAETTVKDSVDGTYRILGMHMDDAIVMSDSMKGHYLELKSDGTGTLYFGEDNNGPISSWSAENGKFSMQAGVSDFSGTIQNGILDLDLGDNMVLAFAKDGADTSSLNIMSLEAYKNSASSTSAQTDKLDPAAAGTYVVYAVESQGVCVLIPEEDKKSLGFTLNKDGTGIVSVKDEQENLLWSLDGNKLLLTETDGSPIDLYEITVQNGIMKLVVPATDSQAEVIEYLVTKDADVSSIKITQ